MLNLNYNINRAIGGGGCIGVTKFNYSASIIVAGGGAGGNTGDGNGVGGGGGGGMAVTQSISIIPNVTYQINVGAGGAINQDAIGNSFLIGFDDNDTIPISFLASGGKIGLFPGGGINNGGNSGSGSIVRAGVTTTYNAFTGGTGSYSDSGGFGPAIAGGGGASNQANGSNGTTASTQARGGNGAAGITSGGGGGAKAGGPTPPPDSQNGQPGLASSGAGRGGNGSGVNPSRGASAGTDGTVIISYTGQPKAFVTNASTTTLDGVTTHTFASGSGTFLYTYPYPWPDVVPYTVEQCPPTAQPPFVPFPRTDLYSASLVLAIPGAIFTNGYNNVFNQITPYDDIAPYIVSGSILNPNTGKYNPYTNTHSLDFTGSLGFYTASVSVNNFSNVGYETSLLFSGSICLRVSKDVGVGNGVNLSTTKPFVIEGWAAMDVTSSVDSNTGRIFAQKYISGNLLTSSFYSVVNFAGDPGNLVSGSILFVGSNISNPSAETVVVSMSSSLDIPKQFRHFAISNTPISGVQSTIRTYVSGILQGQQQFNYDFDLNPQLFVQLFGDEGEGYLNAASASQVPGGYFQDFRMYNGTNKNYTGSLIPIPQSMIQGLVEPYPIVN
jgi:hypothetical protein